MDSEGRPKVNTEMTNERADILYLVLVEHCAPTVEKCPFRDIRKTPWREQIRWTEQLTDIQIQNMVVFHKLCPFNKEHKPTLL
jgi:hypothetical protein